MLDLAPSSLPLSETSTVFKVLYLVLIGVGIAVAVSRSGSWAHREWSRATIPILLGVVAEHGLAVITIWRSRLGGPTGLNLPTFPYAMLFIAVLLSIYLVPLAGSYLLARSAIGVRLKHSFTAVVAQALVAAYAIAVIPWAANIILD